jgi:hypothetical protein
MVKIKDCARNIPGQNKIKMSESEIDEELNDTFPASDPPSWTLGLDPDKVSMEIKKRSHRALGDVKLKIKEVDL